MIKWYWQGVEFSLSLLFPAAAVVMLTFDDTTFTRVCLGASLLHECGHLIAMLWFRDRPMRVCFGLFGARIERHPECRLGYVPMAVISLAGPFVNVLCSVLFWQLDCMDGAIIHGALAAFNLLPVCSLDGGEALHHILCLALPEGQADTLLLAVSVLVLFPLATLGFRLLVTTGYNFTLLALAVYLGLLVIFKEKH